MMKHILTLGVVLLMVCSTPTQTLGVSSSGPIIEGGRIKTIACKEKSVARTLYWGFIQKGVTYGNGYYRSFYQINRCGPMEVPVTLEQHQACKAKPSEQCIVHMYWQGISFFGIVLLEKLLK